LVKFKVAYKEIDVPTSVMFTDSLRTYNSPNFTETQRWLVGKYSDDQFGEITSSAFMQYRPLDPNFTLPDDATLVSGDLYLTVDFYHYGTNTSAPMSLTVHQLTDSLSDYNDDGQGGRLYFFNTAPGYDPKSVGELSLNVNPSAYDLFKEDNEEYLVTRDTLKRHIETYRITLDKPFASELFVHAQSNSDDFKLFRRFKRIFKGLALIPDPSSEVIVGFNPDYDEATLGETRLVLTYTTYDPTVEAVVEKEIEFGLFKYAPGGVAASYQIGFSKIDASREGTELSVLTEKYADVALSNDLGYLQAGNPVVTKLDFGRFFEFVDTISTLSLNSAELVITGVSTDTHEPPDQLALRVLKDDNRFDNSSEISLFYARTIAYDSEGKLVFSGDNSEQFVLNRSEADGQYNYSGFLTSYLQLLYSIKTDSIRYRHYGMIPFEPEFQKSVNRLVFDKNNIKLRLYYTIPNTPQP
jgi:hypothetical protein